MKELIEAAVNAAARSGIQAAVVLVGGDTSQPASHEQCQMALGQANTARAALEQQITDLQTQLQQAAQQVAGAQQTAAGPGALQQAQTELQVAQAELVRAQAELEQLRAVQLKATMAPAGGDVAPPRETVDPIDTYGIEHLGLTDKTAKALRQAGLETIGVVRASYTAGELKVKAPRLTKDGLIEIAIHLLGKAPSASHDTANDNGGGGPAAATNGAPDVPASLKDRPWMERLNAARAKEVKRSTSEAKLKALRENAGTSYPAALVDGVLKLEDLPAEVADDIRDEDNTYQVVRGQVIAMLWSANLPADTPSVDESLRRMGLDALCQTPSAQEPQPAAAGA